MTLQLTLMAHQVEQALERLIPKLVDIYSMNLKRNLADPILLDGAYMSCYNGLLPRDYTFAREILITTMALI